MEQEPVRVMLSDEELNKLSKEDLVLKWKSLQAYVDHREKKTSHLLQEKEKALRELNSSKSFELAKLKNLLLMKYMANSNAATQNQDENSPANSPGGNSPNGGISSGNNGNNGGAPAKMKQSLVDPSVNAVIVQLKKELEETRKQKEDLQDELNVLKFTVESHYGKRLMAKCRKLLQENEELGKLVSTGNVAQLEADLAYHKALVNEAFENERNTNSFIGELDNEMDAMQATIVQYQQKSLASAATTGNTKSSDSKDVKMTS